MRRLNWSALVRKVEKNRAPKARFYKPVCLIAAIDLADEGLLDARNINARAVIDRFFDYVAPIHKDRGDQAYQPLWRLKNDGLWEFYSGSAIVSSKEFAQGIPNTERTLLSKFDRLSIHPDYLDLWNVPKERRALRDYMLIMLNDGDQDSKLMVAPLFNPKNLLDRGRQPNEETLNSYFQTVRDQLPLFRNEDLHESNKPKNTTKDKTNFSKADSPLPAAPDALENIPSPIDYVWADSKITIGPNSTSLPVFPHQNSRRTFEQRLQACSVEARDLLRDLKSRKWQVRSDYTTEVKTYIERLPVDTRSGNILLADATMRALRDIFKADMESLPPTFAARLKALMQQHIAIRPFYPELEEFYRAVRTGKIDDPLPIDAVCEVFEVVKQQTPEVFDESVLGAMDDVSVSGDSSNVSDEKTDISDGSTIEPPSDPLGDLDINKSQDFQTAGNINRLWKVFRAGEVIHSTTQAWVKTYNLLADPVTQIIEWIKVFRG